MDMTQKMTIQTRHVSRKNSFFLNFLTLLIVKKSNYLYIHNIVLILVVFITFVCYLFFQIGQANELF